MLSYERHPSHFLLAAKRAEIASLNQLVSSCRLVTDSCALVHELQRERGLSNVFLASYGERFAKERQQQIQNCLEKEQQFYECLHGLEQDALLSGSTRLFNRLAWVVHGLQRMMQVRQRIARHELTATAATQIFGELISGLLAVVLEVADIATNPDITRLLVALLNLMQGKEYAGQERAWAAIGFSTGHFATAMRERLKYLDECQQRCFQVFNEFSPAQSKDLWDVMVAHADTREFNRLRQVIARTEDKSILSTDISEIWYQLATCRIDRLQEIGQTLCQILLTMCKDKVETAYKELRDHHQFLQKIKTMKAPPLVPISMLLTVTEPENVSCDNDMLSAQGVNPVLARSLYELMAQQSEHLRQVNDELVQVRQVLDERKSLERAKGLLMQGGLTEEQAWKKLRHAAMSSGKTLKEVAQQVLSLSQRD